MEYLWNVTVKVLVVRAAEGRGKYDRNIENFLLPLGCLWDLLQILELGLHKCDLILLLWRDLSVFPSFLWSQRWENYRGCKYSEGSKVPGRAGDVSANAAGFWFLLWFLPVIPEVTEKRKLFYPWQRASRAVQPFLLLLVEKNMSGEWGKAEVKTQDTAIRSYSSTSLFYKEPYQHSTS